MRRINRIHVEVLNAANVGGYGCRLHPFVRRMPSDIVIQIIDFIDYRFYVGVRGAARRKSRAGRGGGCWYRR